MFNISVVVTDSRGTDLIVFISVVATDSRGKDLADCVYVSSCH